MISAIIPTLDSARTLPALLADLVPAAVDGLVREVMVLDRGSSDETHMICEDAGADVLAASIPEAAGWARGEWVLLLPPDLRLRRGWHDAVVVHLQRSGGAALLVDSIDRPGWLARLLRLPNAGVLARRSAVSGLSRELDLTKLRARLGRGAPYLG